MIFTSLSQFYVSDEWRTLRALLIQERTNPADGILYDEHSGLPLINSYDIVAHHKVPLALQNVNDFSISLNPENIMLVSQRSHNEIHARFGFCTERKVYLVHGAPCAGKNTFVNGIKGNSDIVVDLDNIWQCITGGERYHKPNALKTNAFILRDCMLDMVKTRAGKWERAFVLTGAPRKGDRERQIQALGAEPIHIDTTKEVCLERLHSNPQGRNVQEWARYIEDYFTAYQE